MPSQMLNEVEVESSPDSSAVEVVVMDERDLRPMDRVCLTLYVIMGLGEESSSIQFSSAVRRRGGVLRLRVWSFL
jgi:hypothetical protein